MKKTLFFLCLCFLTSNFAVAQSPLAEFEKVRQIRFLQDNRENVRHILADYKADFSEEDDEESFSDDFSTENADIEVTYSSGGCSEDELWNAGKSIVTKIEISLENPIKLKEFKFDFSSYKKKFASEDEDSPEDFVYYDENAGIAFEIEENELREIVLFPSKANASLLCQNDFTTEYFSNEEQFIDLVLKGKTISCPAANMNDLIIETDEILADCENPTKRENCVVWNKEISIEAIANDPDNDPLTYQYTVSGGKIIGQGAKVVWDISGLQPGSYTITAAVDDGCGFCGQAQTKTLVVK